MQWSGSGSDFISLEIEWYCLLSLLLYIYFIDDYFFYFLFFLSSYSWYILGFLWFYYYSVFFLFCHSLLHLYMDLLAINYSYYLIFKRQAWDTLFFLGEDGKSLGFCFYGLEKLFFRFYLSFYCGFLLSFITIFRLLYRFIVFIILFEERCFVIYKSIRVLMPEVDKCLGEIMDRYSL